MEALRKRLGKRLRTLRQEAGLTQEALGEALDLHGSYVGLLERGHKNPSLDTLCKIADFFNLTPAGLLGEDQEDAQDDSRKQIQHLLQQIADKDIKKLYRVLQIVFMKE